MKNFKKFTAFATRGLVAIVAAATIAFGAVALTGCGQSDEEVIKAALTEALDEVKNADDETIEAMLESTDESTINTFEEYGLDMKEYMKAYLSGFDYTVGDITVDGDTATAEVVLTCKTTSTMNTAAQNIDYSSVESLDQVGALLMNAVENAGTTEVPVTLELVKTDGTWGPSDTFDSAISAAISEN